MAQGLVASGAQPDAPAAEARAVADLPGLARTHRRGGADIEAIALQVADRPVGSHRLAAKTRVLVESDLCGRLRGNHQAGHRHRISQCRDHRFLLSYESKCSTTRDSS